MSVTSSTLRVGLIGCGGIARSQHLPHWHSHPGTTVVALADVDSASLAETASAHDVGWTTTRWRELVALEDLDIVDVTTPNCFHAEMAIAALEAGKHVLCEKPMAITAADAERMLTAARKADRLLMINHVFRYDPTLERLRRLSPSSVGRIHHVHARWTRRRGVPTAPTFVRKELAGGGPLLDLGIHMVDLAVWLMGSPRPTRVSAHSGRWLAGRPIEAIGGDWGDWDREAYDVEDYGVGFFHFDDGASLLLEVGWLAFQEASEERSLRVLGEKGGMYWPRGLVTGETRRTPFDMQIKDSAGPSIFEASVHDFADAIQAGEPSPIPPEESLTSVRMIDALYRSAETGREVHLDS